MDGQSGGGAGTAREAGERQRVVLGLGNPGERYLETRHNLGFRVVEALEERLAAGPTGLECNTVLSRGEGLLLGRPQTFMNRSGYAARCLVERYDLEPEDFLIVYDDVALPLGRLRLRRGGSPGGHRGMESVLESLGSDRVPRLRLGIRPPEATEDDDLVAFVLGPFDDEEKETVEAMVLRAAQACETWAREGAEAAMQRFNG